MNYTGKLYGRAPVKRGGYFDTGKSSEDWDRLEAENEALRKDKARLDAIEENRLSVYTTYCEEWGVGRRRTVGTGMTAREAIDAAMEGGGR